MTYFPREEKIGWSEYLPFVAGKRSESVRKKSSFFLFETRRRSSLHLRA